jgi:hypothetical protein
MPCARVSLAENCIKLPLIKLISAREVIDVLCMQLGAQAHPAKRQDGKTAKDGAALLHTYVHACTHTPISIRDWLGTEGTTKKEETEDGPVWRLSV